MKKFITILIILTVVLSYSIAVTADTIVLEQIQLAGINDLSVRQAVTQYFSQRTDYLSGKRETLDLTIPAVENDEAVHKAKLLQLSIEWTESSILIDSIDCSDNFAVVRLTETVVLSINGAEYTEIIPHRLHLYLINGNVPTVALDAYREATSCFSASSYAPETINQRTSTGDGSPLCIINVAMNQVGYTETYNNITVFGEWAWINGQGWCGAFVSWCANHSDVPNISRTGSLDQLYQDCRIYGEVHNSNANGGNYTPKAGDFFFTIGKNGGLGHVGIVSFVSGNTMHTIEGNSSDAVREFTDRTITDTDILYFGSPPYTTNSHTGSYTYDSSYHYKTCENCNAQETSPHNLVVENNYSYHWNSCVQCNYESTKVRHLLVQETVGGLYICRICGFSSSGNILQNTGGTQ